MQLKD